MSKLFKRIRIGILLLAVLFAVFYMWYINRYSMDVIQPYEVTNGKGTNTLLIATQGSDYKDEVTIGIVNGLSDEDVMIKVLDVTALDRENIETFDLAVIIHTIEIWKAPAQAIDFVERSGSDKIYGIATSGDGTLHMEGVDGISCASPNLEANQHATQTVNWIKMRLDEL